VETKSGAVDGFHSGWISQWMDFAVDGFPSLSGDVEAQLLDLMHICHEYSGKT